MLYLYPMPNKLVQYFSEIMPLTNEEEKAIEDSIHLKTFKKGTVLLKEGQVSTECYFIWAGCVRQYSLLDGEEKTHDFFAEGDWLISLDSFTQKTPANHFFACVDDTTLVVGNEEKENALFEQSPKFETIARKVMEQIIVEQQKKINTYITNTSEQRYLNLLETKAALLQSVPQYQIASYIGVKPESLSRMRKRLKNNRNL